MDTSIDSSLPIQQQPLESEEGHRDFYGFDRDFLRGYEFAMQQQGVRQGVIMGAEYVDGVEDAIAMMYDALNDFNSYKSSKAANDSIKGFVAERWAAGSGNVDAALKGRAMPFEVLNSKELGSVDVQGPNALYQLKYYSDPDRAIRALGTTLRDRYHASKASTAMSFEEWAASKGLQGASPSDLLYSDQLGLVPTDMLEACRTAARKRLARAEMRENQIEIERWKHVLEGLTDRVTTRDGVQSRPLTLADAYEKAQKISSHKVLEAADDGMTMAELVTFEHTLTQALRAGGSAAAISAALAIMPEIYKAIDYLIANGELDENSFYRIGAAAVEGGATGFVTGAGAASITIAAGKGMLGQTVKTALAKPFGANAVASLVVLMVGTCKDAYAVARGRMTQEAFADNLERSAFVTALCVAGGAVASALTAGAAIPILVGSLAGSAVGCIAFSPAKTCILQLSSATGITFFGLVEQDYEIPRGTLERLGLHRASYSTAQLKTPELASQKPLGPMVRQAQLQTVGIERLDRNVVALSKIGYVAK